MRIHRLDALRGVAASVVLLQHGMETLGLASSELNARPAVLLFFVLSGFVLALPYVDSREPPWRLFLLRRFLRLWPPVAVTVGLAAGLHLLIAPGPPFLGIWWSQPLDADLIGRCLALSAQNGGCGSLVIPLWSLAYEARVSAIFPLLMLLVMKTTRSTVLAAIVIGFGVEVQALTQGRWAAPIYAHGLIGDINLTLHFAALFVFGMALARHRKDAVRRIAALGAAPRLGLAAFAVALLLLPSDVIRGAASTLVIALVLAAGPGAVWLDGAVVRWLGRVSFSLYLVHQPVLAAFVYMNGGPLSIAQMLAAVGAGLAAAELLFRLVEQPSMMLARRIAAAPRVRHAQPAAAPIR